MTKDETSFSKLARAIMTNYTCLACSQHYHISDDKATCPHCKRTRKQQIEAFMALPSKEVTQ